MSRRLWPVIAAISGSVHPASASRVTAVPRRSWNVRPTIPTAAQALRQLDRNPSSVHGLLSVLIRINVLRFDLASSAALSGAPTGITTRALVLPWRNLMRLPSYADHG